MSQKTAFIICFVLFITLTFVFMAFTFERDRVAKISSPKPITPSPVVFKKTALQDSILFFSPPGIKLSGNNLNTVRSVDLIINSGNNTVSGVQAELSFDPKIVSIISLEPPILGSFFGKKNDYIVLINDIDKNTGRITYAIAPSFTGSPQKGTGSIGVLTFSTKPNTSSIAYLKGSKITMLGENQSVLKDTSPLVIYY